jgi:Ni/Co efflux regulator RcnB
MKRLVTALLASAMAASMTLPAAAQSYQDRQSAYADRQDQYQADQAAYDAQMRDYNSARDQYDRDRAAYDRRYGEGAYVRTYGQFNRPYPPRGPAYVDASASVPPPAAGSASCAEARADAKSSRVGGTILGAIIGGALGSNIAAGGHRNDGTLLGAGVGAVIGNKAGGNTKAGAYAAACDHDGSYYTYDQTYPYREGRDWVPRGERPTRYYTENRCRLAPAQTDSGEYRYVRVCPDRDGRYRLAT